jgi:hydrogenase expression/formation protein HypE
MGNEGKMIAVVSQEDAERALELMRNTEQGKNAALIAEVTDGKALP